MNWHDELQRYAHLSHVTQKAATRQNQVRWYVLAVLTFAQRDRLIATTPPELYAYLAVGGAM